LQIIERHPHTKKVFYVPEGKDAATSYGQIDFKFKNTLPYPIKINSYIEENKIYVLIERT
jgi:vancomycin resistance protein YoaR